MEPEDPGATWNRRSWGYVEPEDPEATWHRKTPGLHGVAPGSSDPGDHPTIIGDRPKKWIMINGQSQTISEATTAMALAARQTAAITM